MSLHASLVRTGSRAFCGQLPPRKMEFPNWLNHDGYGRGQPSQKLVVPKSKMATGQSWWSFMDLSHIGGSLHLRNIPHCESYLLIGAERPSLPGSSCVIGTLPVRRTCLRLALRIEESGARISPSPSEGGGPPQKGSLVSRDSWVVTPRAEHQGYRWQGPRSPVKQFGSIIWVLFQAM